MTGARERWRLRLGPTAPGAVLRGWVFLAWGDRVAVRSLPASERLPRLAAQRGLRLPPARAGGPAGADLAPGLGAQPAAGLGVAAGGS